jgi:nucleotide-binding universal stress UspA family protein
MPRGLDVARALRMQRILVALDGSPRAPSVLETAASLAQRLHARLVLLRTVGLPAELPQDAWKLSQASVLDMLEAHARSYLDEVAAKLPPDIVEAKRVVVGVAWDAICRTARAESVDLVVIGSHGYAGLDKLLGTTASKVVNHVDRAVLVVRAPERLHLES